MSLPNPPAIAGPTKRLKTPSHVYPLHGKTESSPLLPALVEPSHPHSKQPRTPPIPPPVPPSDTISSDSSTDFQISSHLLKFRLNMSNKNTASVKQDSIMKPPILTASNISPAVMHEFEDTCLGFFESKEVADDKQVRKILASFKDV